MRDDNHTEDPPPGHEGEHYEETLSKEPCEEEELDPEEAERRITQFVSSANELAGPPLRNSPSRSLRSCERHWVTSRLSWRGRPTTRYWLPNSCWASALAGCCRTTR